MKMEVFKQRIPEGYSAEIENGEIVYYPIIHEDKCKFEVGNIVVCKSDYGNYDIIRLIHRVSKIGAELKYWSSHELVTDYDSCEFQGGCDGAIIVGSHKKATPEQEKLFKQKCLENGVWFDQVNKKWIELKDGRIYHYDLGIGGQWICIFKSIDKEVMDYCNMDCSNNINYDGVILETNIDSIINISEATEEEKQQLFDAIAKKGKQWNAEKKCVEDLKWKPEEGESYWAVGSALDIYVLKNFCLTNDKDRIKFGNCFKTKEEAKKYAEYMRECSLNYKSE